MMASNHCKRRKIIAFAVLWVILNVMGIVLAKAAKVIPIFPLLATHLGLTYPNQTLYILDMTVSYIAITLPFLLPLLLLRGLIKSVWLWMLWIPISIAGEFLGLDLGWTILWPYRGESYNGVLITAEWLLLGAGWTHEYFLQLYLPAGLLVGTAQFIILRRYVQKGVLWIGASTAGYALGCIAAASFAQAFFWDTRSGDTRVTYWEGLLPLFEAEAIAGFVRGVVTALPLVYWLYAGRGQSRGATPPLSCSPAVTAATVDHPTPLSSSPPSSPPSSTPESPASSPRAPARR